MYILSRLEKLKVKDPLGTLCLQMRKILYQSKLGKKNLPNSFRLPHVLFRVFRYLHFELFILLLIDSTFGVILIHAFHHGAIFRR